MNTPRKSLSLRDARKRKGLSQEMLAERVEVKQNTISKLERGTNREPKYRLGLAIARALEEDPDALRFGGDEAA